MTTTTPSRILDTNEQTDPITSNGHTCTTSKRKTATPEPVNGERCGKPAAVEVIKTCCNSRAVHYWCAQHYAANTTGPVGCVQCMHVCRPGVCLHRIINPI